MPIIDVGGTPEFRSFFSSLSETDPFKIELREARDLLKQDCRRGEKISHNIWPDSYKQMGLTNLWRFRLTSGGRMTYTILSDENGFIVSIIEAFRTHREYERRFGY